MHFDVTADYQLSIRWVKVKVYIFDQMYDKYRDSDQDSVIIWLTIFLHVTVIRNLVLSKRGSKMFV